jgi:hypothetical protein
MRLTGEDDWELDSPSPKYPQRFNPPFLFPPGASRGGRVPPKQEGFQTAPCEKMLVLAAEHSRRTEQAGVGCGRSSEAKSELSVDRGITTLHEESTA